MSLLDPAIWQGKAFSSGWQEASAGEFAVTEKATGKQLGTVAMAAPEDIAKASAAAAAAQTAWAATPYTQRAAILRKAGDIWLSHAAEIEDWNIRESGKIPPAAQFETQPPRRPSKPAPSPAAPTATCSPASPRT
jgi:benzaldehyde dehydrogenase (NAD)